MSSLTLGGSITTGKNLITLMPKVLPEDEATAIKKAAERLTIAIDDAEEALAGRFDNKVDLRLERLFDLLVDRVWVTLKNGLEFWSCYDHEGVDLLSEDEQNELDIEGGRELAEKARELLDGLFGEGTEFLRLPYPQQAAQMAARLRFVENRGLGPVFIDLVGDRPVALAKVCQRRYEAMVAERSARDNAVAIDLRLLRSKISDAAENYANLLIATLPGGDEAWAKVVLKALRPMLSIDKVREHSETDDANEQLSKLEAELEAAEDEPKPPETP
jgi:hypothetical protein